MFLLTGGIGVSCCPAITLSERCYISYISYISYITTNVRPAREEEQNILECKISEEAVEEMISTKLP